MPNIYTFRVLLDTEQEVFRDIEIKPEQTFETLHHAIQDAFDFSGNEMASFYMSNDDWERGKELPLMDMSFGDGEELHSMAQVKIGELIRKKGQKLIYIYDFLRMWAFFVEMVGSAEAESGKEYPAVAMSLGDAPEEGSKDMDFNIETDSADGDDDDDYYDDEFEEGLDDDDLDQLTDRESF
jgi:hypothetical protein